jgi:hypothetical protein
MTISEREATEAGIDVRNMVMDEAAAVDVEGLQAAIERAEKAPSTMSLAMSLAELMRIDEARGLRGQAEIDYWAERLTNLAEAAEESRRGLGFRMQATNGVDWSVECDHRGWYAASEHGQDSRYFDDENELVEWIEKQ